MCVLALSLKVVSHPVTGTFTHSPVISHLLLCLCVFGGGGGYLHILGGLLLSCAQLGPGAKVYG